MSALAVLVYLAFVIVEFVPALWVYATSPDDSAEPPLLESVSSAFESLRCQSANLASGDDWATVLATLLVVSAELLAVGRASAKTARGLGSAATTDESMRAILRLGRRYTRAQVLVDTLCVVLIIAVLSALSLGRQTLPVLMVSFAVVVLLGMGSDLWALAGFDHDAKTLKLNALANREFDAASRLIDAKTRRGAWAAGCVIGSLESSAFAGAVGVAQTPAVWKVIGLCLIAGAFSFGMARCLAFLRGDLFPAGAALFRIGAIGFVALWVLLGLTVESALLPHIWRNGLFAVATGFLVPLALPGFAIAGVLGQGPFRQLAWWSGNRSLKVLSRATAVEIIVEEAGQTGGESQTTDGLPEVSISCDGESPRRKEQVKVVTDGQSRHRVATPHATRAKVKLSKRSGWIFSPEGGGAEKVTTTPGECVQVWIRSNR